jgi:GNAT superfamily N-acetyltransferase
MNMPIEVRPITTAETLPLRMAILRPHRPIETAHFPGDDDPTTTHIGAYTAGNIVAIASLFSAALPERCNYEGDSSRLESPWQLRGMAVSNEFQQRGYGKAMLDACVAQARSQGGTLIWCNARNSALGFYKKAGFVMCSEEFFIPDVGPHHVMLRFLIDVY